MCGIAGYCLAPSERCDASKLSRRLLLGIEERGRHATGAAWRNDDKPGTVQVFKRATSASKLVHDHAHRITPNACSAVLHTRWATKGDPTNSLNNHPIVCDKVALVHNGHVSNDDDIFRRLNVRRRGQVDTEAIAALLAYGEGDVTDLLSQVSGGAAVAWLNAEDRNNTLHLARVSYSPLHVAQTKAGSLLYASTKQAVVRAAQKCKLELTFHWDVPERTYIKVKNGRVIEEQQIKAPVSSYLSDDEYGWLQQALANH